MAKTWFKQSINFTECHVAQVLSSQGKYFEFFLYQKLLEIIFRNDQESVTIDLRFLSRQVAKKLDKTRRSLEDLAEICSRSTDDSPKIHLRFTEDWVEIVAPNLLKLQESSRQTRLDKTRLEEKRLDKNIINDHSRDQTSEVTTEDLEQAYKNYPRKAGKSKGLSKAKRDIKTRDDLASFILAITHYRMQLEKENTAPQFIKHFSTFVSEWRDWITPPPAPAPILPEAASERLRGVWPEGVPFQAANLIKSHVEDPSFWDWINGVIGSPKMEAHPLGSDSLKAYVFAAIKNRYGVQHATN